MKKYSVLFIVLMALTCFSDHVFASVRITELGVGSTITFLSKTHVPLDGKVYNYTEEEWGDRTGGYTISRFFMFEFPASDSYREIPAGLVLTVVSRPKEKRVYEDNWDITIKLQSRTGMPVTLVVKTNSGGNISDLERAWKTKGGLKVNVHPVTIN